MELASVIVVSYNSASYVIETLNSIKAQTYKNIELIITDDSSSDNTVDICRNWLILNKERFVNTELITSDTNTGISANCNRGINVANGVWVKLIAADDLLTKDAITQFITFAAQDASINVVHSNQHVYKNTFEPENFVRYRNKSKEVFNDLRINARLQFLILLKQNYIYAPTILIRKEALKAIGGYDERMRLIEDAPLFFRLLNKGYKFHFLEEVTVNYRQHDKSISNSNKDKGILQIKNWERKIRFDEYILPYLKNYEKPIYRLYYIYLRYLVAQNGIKVNKLKGKVRFCLAVPYLVYLKLRILLWKLST